MRFTGWMSAGFGALLAVPAACGGDAREEPKETAGSGGTRPVGGTLGTGGTARPDGGTTGHSGAIGGAPDSGPTLGSGGFGGIDAGPDAPRDAAFDVTDGAARADADASCMEIGELQSFWRTWAEGLCDGLVPCCLQSGLSLDRNACVTTFVSYFGRILGGAACNRSSPDLSRLAECAEKSKAFTALCDVDRPIWREATLACFSVMQGARGLGEPCNLEVDCAQPAGREVACAEIDHVNGGRYYGCQEQRLAAEGQPCNPDSRELVAYDCDEAAGLYCPLIGSKVCARRAPVGAPCPDGRCDDQGFCDGGRCVARRAPGQPCGTGNTMCAIDARCDASSGICVALKGLGQSCAENSDCLSYQCVSGKCAPNTPWTSIVGCQ
jgi:hypothetical protein